SSYVHQVIDLDVIRFFLPFYCFFSSRRRHTRFSRDWSSDVCSSDLVVVENDVVDVDELFHPPLGTGETSQSSNALLRRDTDMAQIGRASCRERGTTTAVGVSIKKERNGN